MPNVELSRLWNVAKAFFFYAVTYLEGELQVK